MELFMDKHIFESFVTIPVNQPVAVRGLHTWPFLYEIIIDELRRCVSKSSYLGMYYEQPSDNIFNTSIYDIIRNNLKGTDVNLEVVKGELTLNLNKFIYPEDTKVKKTLYKLQWDEKSYITLRDIKIPEFFAIVEEFKTEFIAIKEQVKDYPLYPPTYTDISHDDEKLSIANKKRFKGLCNILDKLEYLYMEVYVRIVNEITEQILKLEKPEHEETIPNIEDQVFDVGEERFTTRLKEVADIIMKVPKITQKQFIEQAEAGDIILSYKKGNKLNRFGQFTSWVTSSFQGMRYNSSKMVYITPEGKKMVVGYGVANGTTNFSKMGIQSYINNCGGCLLIKHPKINTTKRERLNKLIGETMKRDMVYSNSTIIKTAISHILKKTFNKNSKEDKNKNELICSTIIAILYRQVSLDMGSMYSDTEIWPIDFLLSPKLNKVGAYFARNEYDETTLLKVSGKESFDISEESKLCYEDFHNCINGFYMCDIGLRTVGTEGFYSTVKDAIVKIFEWFNGILRKLWRAIADAYFKLIRICRALKKKIMDFLEEHEIGLESYLGDGIDFSTGLKYLDKWLEDTKVSCVLHNDILALIKIYEQISTNLPKLVSDPDFIKKMIDNRGSVKNDIAWFVNNGIISLSGLSEVVVDYLTNGNTLNIIRPRSIKEVFSEELKRIGIHDLKNLTESEFKSVYSNMYKILNEEMDFIETKYDEFIKRMHKFTLEEDVNKLADKLANDAGFDLEKTEYLKKIFTTGMLICKLMSAVMIKNGTTIVNMYDKILINFGKVLSVSREKNGT